MDFVTSAVLKKVDADFMLYMPTFYWPSFSLRAYWRVFTELLFSVRVCCFC